MQRLCRWRMSLWNSMKLIGVSACSLQIKYNERSEAVPYGG